MTAPAGVDGGRERESSGMSLAGALDRHLESPSLALPVCPESAARILEELEAEGTDSEALQRIAGRDPALVVCLLREANGPEFDALERVATIDKALSRLGEERVGGLVGSTVTNARLPSGDPVLTQALHHTWKRSLAVALVAPTIAARTGDGDLAGDAHLLGLLSDVGVVFLISALHALKSQAGDRLPLTEVAQREVLDQLQQAYGIRVLEHWNFPPGVLAILARRAVGRDEHRQSLFLRVARQVVSSIGLPPVGGEGKGADANELWELAEALELSTVDVAALQVQAEDLVATLDAEPASGS
jgi:HD-like signal output (HDOD) protein